MEDFSHSSKVLEADFFLIPGAFLFFPFARMCKTIKVLKALNIFRASFPLHHRSKEEASILARGLGFSVANMDVMSMVALC